MILENRTFAVKDSIGLQMFVYTHLIYTMILVAVRKLQVAILARLSRKMSQTVRID